MRLHYDPLPMPVIMLAVGDSAFQAPTDEEAATDPLVMRGYGICLAHETITNGLHSYQLQVMEYCSGKQSRVTRGVWSAELYNQSDMVDMAAILLGFMEEVRRGPQTAEQLKQIHDTGDYTIPLHITTDSNSIFSYLSAQHLKFPAEKATYFHLAYLREVLVLLEKKVTIRLYKTTFN